MIHFAGLKAVGESKQKPLSYYRVNHGGTVNILEVFFLKFSLILVASVIFYHLLEF